jgi:hypothetical protein
VRPINGQRRVGLSDERHQLGVPVERAGGDQIDDADGDAVSHPGGALADEGVPRLGSVLVGQADDLDGPDRVPASAGVVHADLVLVDGDVDLNLSAGVDFRPGDVAGWQQSPQLLDENRRPLAVQLFPRGGVGERRPKVIA